MSSSQMLAVCMIALVLAASSLPGAAAAPADRNRKLLQFGGGYRNNPSSIGPNSVRAQAATSQNIEEAVLRGGSLSSTRRAGVTGVATGWAVGQGNNVYNIADRAFAPNTFTAGR